MKSISVEYAIYYGATPDVFNKAKELRKSETDAEKQLWKLLNKNQVLGLQFRRQHPINRFIADFYCHKIRLVIELDGGVHQSTKSKEYDAGRSEVLSSFGITVVRFTNNQIFDDTESVINKIKEISQALLIKVTND
jgi:very-short-patch-repair endonuclease